MSIASDLYYRDVFVPDIYGTKTVAWRKVCWAQLVEPVHHGYGNPEMLLAGAERMLDSSRTYFTPGRWGTDGVTGHLLDSSCVNMQHRALHLYGTMKEVKETCRRLFTIGFLTSYSGAPRWREEQGISLMNKFRLTGPFDESPKSQEKAWDRLRALSGQRIVPKNTSHPGAREITFSGMMMMDGRKGRSWTLDFYVQYPREKYGSGWKLSFLCRDGEFDFKRGEAETFAQWCTRVADFVEGLVVNRTDTMKRREVAATLREWRAPMDKYRVEDLAKRKARKRGKKKVSNKD